MENCFYIGLIFALIAVYVKGDFPTGATQALSCIFKNTFKSPCHSDNELKIPSNLFKLFNELPESTQERLQNGELESLTDMQFASLPVVFLALLPENRLSHLDASKLVRVIATHPGDLSLAYHMVSGVKTAQQKVVFMEKVSRLNTSTEVKHVLASTTSHILNTLQQREPHVRDIIHMPFLVHMPPRYLLQLNNSEAQRIVSSLPKEIEYEELTPLETRIWALLSIDQQTKFDWQLTGFTEEDLTRISVTPDKFKTDFNIIQARAVFEKAYENKICNRINFVESILLLPKQTPSTLQKFPMNVHDYLDFTILPPSSSLATSKQIMEYIIANCLETKKLGDDKYKWGQRIKYVKKWVYALPPSVLKQYRTQTVLSHEILYETQSKMLTDRQAYYLTAQGQSLNLSLSDSILKFTDNLLSALPTTQLQEHSMGSYSSRVLEHLLGHLPDKNVPRMVSLLVKTIDSFDSDEVFYNLLKNKAAYSYFDLISSSNIRQSSSSILSKLKQMEKLNLYSIDQLPSRILSVLLRAAKLDDMWTWGNFINSSQPVYMVINGLNCDHVNNMAITDFTTIIAYYNQQREVLKKVFPKNLQYCCLRKLMDYLKMKVELQGVYQDRETVLGPMEIEAVGGYVLLGLPTEVIEENKYKKLIFAAIGKLSIPELLTATDLTKLKEIAKLAVKYLFDQHFADYFELGNLVWFVHPKTLPESSTSTFKLAIEGQMLDKRLCLGTEERDAWSTILIQCFGLPESWSKGKLSTLGDLLLVFPEDLLLRVNETSWVDAADTLQSNYYDTVEWTRPMPFYKVCLMVLDEKEGKAYLSAVKGLVRWRLRAAERQLNSVYKASNVQLKTKKLHSLEINSNGLIKQSNMKVKPYNPFDEENTEITGTAEINDSTEYGEELSTETEDKSTTEVGEESSSESNEELTTEIKEESTTEIKEEPTTEIKEESTTEIKEESTTEIKEELTAEIKEESTTEIKEEPTAEIKEELTTEIKEESKTEIKEESATGIKEELTTEIKEEPTTEIKEESITEIKEEPTTEIKEESTTEIKEEPRIEIKAEPTTEIKEESTTETKEKLTFVTKEKSSTEIKKESTTEIKEEPRTEIKEEPTTEIKEKSTTEKTKEKLPIVTKEELSTEIKEESTTETTKKESTTETKEKLTFETKEKSSTEQKLTTKIKVESTNEINGESTKIEALNNQTTETIDDVTYTLEISTEKFTPSKTTLGQTLDATINTKTTEQYKLSNNESHISNKSSTEKKNFYSDSLVTEKNRTTIIEVKPTTVNNNVTFNHTTQNKVTVPSNNRTTVLPQNITKSINTSAIYNNETLRNGTVTDSQSQITNTTPKQNSIWFSDIESTSPNSTSSSVEVSSIDNGVNLKTDNQTVEETLESIIDDATSRTKRSIYIDWSTIKFSCDALKMVGEIAALSLTSEDIDNMKHAELNDCGDVLGQFDLQDDVYNNIWGRLDEKDPIHLMGNLLKAFTVTDLMSNKMKLSEPWTLETISALSQQTTEIFLIDSLLDELKWQNSNLKKINVETIAALNGLICHLDIENIQSIWLNFHHVVVLLGRLPGCPVCLAKLAEIAISQNGFGNIEQWKVEDVETLGSIVAGLNNSLWNDFLQSPNNLLLGLQPAAINCISTVQLQTIPKEMFSSIPPLTLAMITKEKLIDLTDEQRSAIQDVKNLKINADFLSKKIIVIAGYPGSSSTMHGLSLTLILLIISLYAFL